MENFYIMIVKVNHRVQKVPLMQEIFTKHGDIIEVRLGLHESNNLIDNHGLIILQLTGSEKILKNFEKELNEVEGIDARLVEI